MAGKASNPLSVNQAPQYGDKSALDSFRRETTTTPMTGNVVPKTPAGRPATGSSGGGATPAGVSPETYAKMQSLARAKKTANFWAQLEQSSPSPVTRFYNYHAQEAYKKAANAVYASTPNFE